MFVPRRLAPSADHCAAAAPAAGAPDPYANFFEKKGMGSRSMLQRHVSFFDENNDGFITTAETFRGLERIGFSTGASLALAPAIMGVLGSLISFNASRAQAPEIERVLRNAGSSATFIPLLSFVNSIGDIKVRTIAIADVSFGKHPSDTGIFDADGNVIEEKREALFSKYAGGGDSLDAEEFSAMIHRNAEVSHNVLGMLASLMEFGMLMSVCTDTTKLDTNGKRVPSISRERVRELYDGTLFYRVAGEVSARAACEAANR